MVGELPKAVRKMGVHTRKMSVEMANDLIHRKISEEKRGRCKTFSHPGARKMSHEKRIGPWTKRCFVAKFAPPHRHLSQDRVLGLKSYHVSRYALSGVILVKDISYEKRVFVRYTLDGWTTSEDVEAQFLSADSANNEVTFQFRLDFPFRLPNETKLELALAYQLPDSTIHWDNNDGDNYVFGYSFLP